MGASATTPALVQKTGLRRLFGNAQKRDWAFSAVFAIAFSAAQVVGWFVQHGGTFAQMTAGQMAVCAVAFILLSIVVTCVCVAFFCRVVVPANRCADSVETDEPLVPLEGSASLGDGLRRAVRLGGAAIRRFFNLPHAGLAIWGLIVLFWLPVYVALFPGLLTYDPLYEVKWFLSDGVITSFHTLAHSAWLAASFVVGTSVFGSREAGMALYATMQVLLLSGAFAFCVRKLKSFGAPVWIQAGSLSWFAMMPLHAVLAMTATKDVAFTAFFVVSTVLIFEALRDPREFFRTWRKPVVLGATLLLMFAFRKNGVYAFVVAAPFVIAACRGARVKMAMLVVACLAAAGMYFGPVHHAVCTEETPTVPPAGKTEAFSVPLQQLARVMVEDDGCLDAETRSRIESYVPAWAQYNERIVDPIKFGNGKSDRIESDPAGFLALWAQVGLSRPAVYCDAWTAMSYGYWYVDFRFSSFLEGYPYLDWASVQPGSITDADADAFVFIDQQSDSLGAKLVGGLMRRMPWEGIPVLSWLFSPGLMVWMLAFAVVASLHARRYRTAAVFVLPLAYAASCLLGPTLLIRYAYPLFACLPLAAVAVWLSSTYDGRRRYVGARAEAPCNQV